MTLSEMAPAIVGAVFAGAAYAYALLLRRNLNRKPAARR